MKSFNGLQQSYRFLVAHKLVSFAALTLIIVSSFAGNLLVSRTFSAHADTTNSIPPPTGGGWQLAGTAVMDSATGGIQLTTGDQGYAAASAYYATPISPTSLTASFDATIDQPGFAGGADGLTFALIDADKAPNPALGGAGGNLGFGYLAGRAVTLTENQRPWGCYPSDHFIGITDGTVPSSCPLTYLTTNAAIPPLLGSTTHVVVTVTGGSTPEFIVSLNGQQYLDFHDSVPLPTHIFVGFTAGTGIGSERHLVSNIQISYTDTTPPPTTDPIVGDWHVTYGAPAMVGMTLSGGVYTVTAKTPVWVTGSSCVLRRGTILATFSSIGGNAYSGQHGLWHTSDCSFGFWDPMGLTLSSDSNTLTGVLSGGYGTVTFTKPSPIRVVVMGDSYASGEGTYNNGNAGNPPSFKYYTATGTTTDRCHRSPGAYAPLLGVDVVSRDGQNNGDFVACSGATTYQIIHGKYDEPSQLNILDSSVGIVIISAGGDDAHFAGVLDACTDAPGHSRTPGDCKQAVGNAVGLFPTISKDLGSLYDTIESMTHGAHLIVVGYPKVFPAGGSEGCNWITADKQRYINQATGQLDAMISLTASQHNATFVDTRPLFAGHEVCAASTGVPYINDLQLDKFLAHNCPDVYLAQGDVCSQSYHPNSLAYAAEANLLQGVLDALIRAENKQAPFD